MPKEHQAPAPFTEEAKPHIPMTPVVSNQLASIGYDATTKTLAVTFTRGTGAEYHYPNCEPKLHQDFMAADSKGAFFGKHIKPLAFKKYQAAPVLRADSPDCAGVSKPLGR